MFKTATRKSFQRQSHCSPCSARMTFSSSSTRPRAFLPMKCLATAGQCVFGTARAEHPFSTRLSHVSAVGSSFRLGFPLN